MIRFLSGKLKKHTKLAKIVKISISVNRLVFPMNFNRFSHPMTKVMFSVVSVCQSFCSQGGVHATITYDALDLTIQGLSFNHFSVKVVGKSFISPLNFDLFLQNLNGAHYLVNEPPRPVILCRCHPQCFYLFKAMYLLEKYKSSLQCLLGRKSSCFVTQQRPVHNNSFKNGCINIQVLLMSRLPLLR